MSITLPGGVGQLPAQVLNGLLSQVKRDYYQSLHRSELHRRAYHPAPPRSKESEAAIRAYWGDLWKDEIAALETEWAEPRDITPITSDSLPVKEDHVSVKQAS